MSHWILRADAHTFVRLHFLFRWGHVRVHRVVLPFSLVQWHRFINFLQTLLLLLHSLFKGRNKHWYYSYLHNWIKCKNIGFIRWTADWIELSFFFKGTDQLYKVADLEWILCKYYSWVALQTVTTCTWLVTTATLWPMRTKKYVYLFDLALPLLIFVLAARGTVAGRAGISGRTVWTTRVRWWWWRRRGITARSMILLHIISKSMVPFTPSGMQKAIRENYICHKFGLHCYLWYYSHHGIRSNRHR